MTQAIKLAGRYAGLYVRLDEVEHFGGKLARNTHPGDLFGILYDDTHNGRTTIHEGLPLDINKGGGFYSSF
jgi:hypothetical protein